MSASHVLLAFTPHRDITVAADGSGDYKTITEALNQLPMFNYERVVIFIKKGIYDEKIRIEQDFVTLLGEDRDSTIVQFSQLREDWLNAKDAIGPAVVNIHADDIVLENLMLINTQPKTGPHAFTVYGVGTRTILNNCTILSKGADTVSLWNYKNGLYYHARCTFEGGVDFVCPRGWCYITDSQFRSVETSAAIWHAATTEIGQKLVIRNSTFDGKPGFQLGRHHYDALFMLLQCTFTERLADKPIYRVVYPDQPERNRPYLWGDRYYFYHCTKPGSAYPWLNDNLQQAGYSPEEITAAWTFEGKWNPESRVPPVLKGWEIRGNALYLFFSEPLTIRGTPVLKLPSGTRMRFVEGRGRDTLHFEATEDLDWRSIAPVLQLEGGEVLASEAGIYERILPSQIKLSRKSR